MINDGCDNGRIQLYSKTMFNPLQPDPDAVTITDIAHAASMQCRYGGHCNVFYSVAEHSLLVSAMLKQWGYDPIIQMAGLMHDCDEALGLPDLPRPVKNFMPAYKEAGERLQKVVFEKYGLPYPFPAEVHLADNSILFLYERPALMGSECEEHWKYDGELREADVRIANLWPDNAQDFFLRRYDVLKHEIGMHLSTRVVNV